MLFIITYTFQSQHIAGISANMEQVEHKDFKSSEDIERCKCSTALYSLLQTLTFPADPTTQEGKVQNLTRELVGLTLQPTNVRNMSPIQTIAAGWIISNSWAGIAATFALAVAQGGPVTLIYGPIIMLFLIGCTAVTLAELASVYPTAGGQYHWTSILAPKKISRGLVGSPACSVRRKSLAD